MTRPHPNFTALQNVTREMLEPIWCDTRITTEEIALPLGVSVSGVCYRAKALGLPYPRPVRGRPKTGRDKDAEFRRMWLAGVKMDEIAKAFSTSKNYVGQKRIRMGLPPRRAKAGAGGYGGFGSITLQEYRETLIAKAMARGA